METVVITAGLPIIVILLFGTVAVMLVGVVGGPIKVETPIIMTIVHVVVFCVWASAWPGRSFAAYVAILVACVAVQIAVGLDLFESDNKRLPYWLARGLLASAHIGLILLVLGQAGLM